MTGQTLINQYSLLSANLSKIVQYFYKRTILQKIVDTLEDIILIHESEEVFPEHFQSFEKWYQIANQQSAAKLLKLTISAWSQHCIGREKLILLSINKKSHDEIKLLSRALLNKNTKVSSSLQAYLALPQQPDRQDQIQILIKPVQLFFDLDQGYRRIRQIYDDVIKFTIWKLIIIEQILLVCIWMKQHKLMVHNLGKHHFILDDLETREKPPQKLRFIAFEEIKEIQSPEELSQYYKKLGDLIYYILFGQEIQGNEFVSWGDKLANFNPKWIMQQLHELLLNLSNLVQSTSLKRQPKRLVNLFAAVQLVKENLKSNSSESRKFPSYINQKNSVFYNLNIPSEDDPFLSEQKFYSLLYVGSNFINYE